MAGLPDLSTAYALASDQIAAFRHDGHVLLRGVASAHEVAAYHPIISGLVERASAGAKPMAQRSTYHQAFLQIANLWETDEPAARFTCARRFARLAAELLGVDAVRLYHDQALFKEPGGGATFWHQDQYYWPLATDKMVTMWMPLVDVPLEMGVLTFASGSHVDGPLTANAISEASDAALGALVAERGFPIAQAPLAAGDATFHTGWTAHYAPPNETGQMRAVMTVIYYADGARLLPPANAHQPADLARWFPGQQPGEIAASALNPVLYCRGPA